ncbi:hypothetical protein N9242_01205 [Vicingaceae bacterium]|nr:hypothetical protein [Vicingaceae bacterium]
MTSKEPNSNQDQLDWLAFQYISDELVDQQRFEFEKRLAKDQCARDAVTRQVELAQSLYRHFDESVVFDEGKEVQLASRSATGSKIGWSSIAVTASVVIALLAISWFLQSGDDKNKLANGDNEQLVDAWVFARMNQVGYSEAEDSAVNDVGDSIEFAMAEHSDDEEIDLGDSWMVLALSDIDDPETK